MGSDQANTQHQQLTMVKYLKIDIFGWPLGQICVVENKSRLVLWQITTDLKYDMGHINMLHAHVP